MCVHLGVQLHQLLVDVLQLRLQTLVLVVILVKLPFVVQTLLLIHDGGKAAADDSAVKGLLRAARPLTSRSGNTGRLVLLRHSPAEVLLLQIVSRLRPRVVVLHPGLHGCHRTADFRVSATQAGVCSIRNQKGGEIHLLDPDCFDLILFFCREREDD